MTTGADVLKKAEETYRERNKTYSDNYVRVGRAMAAMFPEGLHVQFDKDWTRLMSETQSHLDMFAVVGMTGRFMAQNLHPEFIRNARLSCYIALDLRAVKAAGAKYGEMKVQIDIDFALQMLLAGYENAVITSFAHDQQFDQPGGCQNYRTAKVLQEASIQLAERYPDFVRTVWREPKGGWKTMGGRRLEVVVSWKKAAARGQEE